MGWRDEVAAGDATEDKQDTIIADIDEILDRTRSGADISVTATETNLFIDDVPIKIISGRVMKIDLSNMAANDTYEFREYYRLEDTGSYICSDPLILSDAQTNPLLTFGLSEYRNGCKVTAKKTAGTDRSFYVEAIGGV